MPLIPWFDRFPNEAHLVGAILTGYGELEFWLCSCVASVLDGDVNTAARLLFRLRNESQRIDAADALLYPAMQRLNIGGPYSHAIGALRFCKTIRNQYAHCHWDADRVPGRLWLCNMEDAAETSDGDTMVKFVETSETLLAEQWEYFDYCLEGLRYIRLEQEVRAGREKEHDCPTPTARQRPKLHIPLG